MSLYREFEVITRGASFSSVSPGQMGHHGICEFLTQPQIDLDPIPVESVLVHPGGHHSQSSEPTADGFGNRTCDGFFLVRRDRQDRARWGEAGCSTARVRHRQHHTTHVRQVSPTHRNDDIVADGKDGGRQLSATRGIGHGDHVFVQ